MQLRPYQEKCLTKLKGLYDSGTKRCVIKHATGLGKTPVIAALPDFFGFKGRILVIVHRETLATQAVHTMQQWNPGVSVGLEMADSRAGAARIVVASIQTIGRAGSQRLAQFDPRDFDAVLVDEAHHAMADSYQSVFRYFGVDRPGSRILLVGVTATPNRSDGKGLNKVFDCIADDLSILWGIEKGWLVDLPAIRANTKVCLDGITVRGGDLATGELEQAVNISARNDLIVRVWLAKASDRKTLVFTVDIQHGKDLALAFQSYGIAAQAVWGDDPHQKEKLAAHRSGGLQVLCNCNLLTEGYDDRSIRCIVMARPTKSETLYAQMVGRGSRLPDGIDNLLDAIKQGVQLEKRDCLVIDVADVTLDNSLVTLSSLFGLGPGLDLDGKSPMAVVEKLKEAQAKVPSADLTKLRHIDDIEKYLETIDLFKVEYPKEILQISDYQWHRAFDGSYVLLLMQNENVCVYKDMLDVWHAKGIVNGAAFDNKYEEFEPAIREADSMVRVLGGRGLVSCVRREAKWHKQPPSIPQVNLCRRLKLKIPPGATQGDVHKAINSFMARKQPGWKSSYDKATGKTA